MSKFLKSPQPQSCINRICLLMSKISNKAKEYFGAFRASVLVSDLSLLQQRLPSLIQAVRGEGEVEGRQRPLIDGEALMPDIVASCFWRKFFDGEMEVEGERFMTAFIDHYGVHPPEGVEKFKKVG